MLHKLLGCSVVFLVVVFYLYISSFCLPLSVFFWQLNVLIKDQNNFLNTKEMLWESWVSLFNFSSKLTRRGATGCGCKYKGVDRGPGHREALHPTVPIQITKLVVERCRGDLRMASVDQTTQQVCRSCAFVARRRRIGHVVGYSDCRLAWQARIYNRMIVEPCTHCL